MTNNKARSYKVNGIDYSEFSPDITPLQAKLSLTHLDIEEIDRRLRVERHDTRKKAACNMKADLIREDRCPKCTLKPPCKHYESAEHFFTRKTVLLSQEDWLLMDQDNRDTLI